MSQTKTFYSGSIISLKDSEHGYPIGIPAEYVMKVPNPTQPGTFVYYVDFNKVSAPLHHDLIPETKKDAIKKNKKIEKNKKRMKKEMKTPNRGFRIDEVISTNIPMEGNEFKERNGLKNGLKNELNETDQNNNDENYELNYFDVLSTSSTTESIHSIQSFESRISDTSIVLSEPSLLNKHNSNQDIKGIIMNNFQGKKIQNGDNNSNIQNAFQNAFQNTFQNTSNFKFSNFPTLKLQNNNNNNSNNLTFQKMNSNNLKSNYYRNDQIIIPTAPILGSSGYQTPPLEPRNGSFVEKIPLVLTPTQQRTRSSSFTSAPNSPSMTASKKNNSNCRGGKVDKNLNHFSKFGKFKQDQICDEKDAIKFNHFEQLIENTSEESLDKSLQQLPPFKLSSNTTNESSQRLIAPINDVCFGNNILFEQNDFSQNKDQNNNNNDNNNNSSQNLNILRNNYLHLSPHLNNINSITQDETRQIGQKVSNNIPIDTNNGNSINKGLELKCIYGGNKLFSITICLSVLIFSFYLILFFVVKSQLSENIPNIPNNGNNKVFYGNGVGMMYNNGQDYRFGSKELLFGPSYYNFQHNFQHNFPPNSPQAQLQSQNQPKFDEDRVIMEQLRYLLNMYDAIQDRKEGRDKLDNNFYKNFKQEEFLTQNYSSQSNYQSKPNLYQSQSQFLPRLQSNSPYSTSWEPHQHSHSQRHSHPPSSSPASLLPPAHHLQTPYSNHPVGPRSDLMTTWGGNGILPNPKTTKSLFALGNNGNIYELWSNNDDYGGGDDGDDRGNDGDCRGCAVGRNEVESKVVVEQNFVFQNNGADIKADNDMENAVIIDSFDGGDDGDKLYQDIDVLIQNGDEKILQIWDEIEQNQKNKQNEDRNKKIGEISGFDVLQNYNSSSGQLNQQQLNQPVSNGNGIQFSLQIENQGIVIDINKPIQDVEFWREGENIKDEESQHKQQTEHNKQTEQNKQTEHNLALVKQSQNDVPRVLSEPMAYSIDNGNINRVIQPTFINVGEIIDLLLEKISKNKNEQNAKSLKILTEKILNLKNLHNFKNLKIKTNEKIETNFEDKNSSPQQIAQIPSTALSSGDLFSNPVLLKMFTLDSHIVTIVMIFDSMFSNFF
jgi:hypothetical protein